MIFHERPVNFDPQFEIVSCFCEFEGQFLMLLRQDYKPQGNKWGLPAGKKDQTDASISAAIRREVREETGQDVNEESFNFLGTVFVRYPDMDFVYNMFRINLETKPEVILSSKEHKAYQWITPNNALALNLVNDLDNCIKLIYQT